MLIFKSRLFCNQGLIGAVFSGAARGGCGRSCCCSGLGLFKTTAVGGGSDCRHCHQEKEEEIQTRGRRAAAGSCAGGHGRRRRLHLLERAGAHRDDPAAGVAGQPVQQLHAVRGHQRSGRKGARETMTIIVILKKVHSILNSFSYLASLLS